MIILSLNVRGLGGAPTILALKRLCHNVSPDVIFLQETKLSGSWAIDSFSNWL